MLLLYTDIKSSRVDYTFQTVFTTLLGIEFDVTNDVSEFKNYNGPRLSYANSRIDKEFFIQRCELLKEGPVVPTKVIVSVSGEQIYLFPTGGGSDLNYDIFAAIFYMLARYEEYLPFEPDDHGRFESRYCLARIHNFLEKPVVNHWVIELGGFLKRRFPELTIAESKFSGILTYDIDVAYEYKGRSLIRWGLSSFKDLITLNPARLLERIKVARGISKDPWDTYDYIVKTVKQSKLEAIFFFLVGSYSSKDKNLHYGSTTMKQLIKRIASFFKVGLHPSYSSSLNKEMIVKEKTRLESITGTEINISRQHFLKFSLPHTYQYLLTAGITEDYSMGFADAPGFRAGICSPYYFYDLRTEKVTSLKIFPITCMEGNFLKYMKVNREQAIAIISGLVYQVKAVNGIFISIWHNHTLSDKGIYEGWKKVHDEMIQKIVSMKENKLPG